MSASNSDPGQPAVKDEDAAHPIASEWRSTLCEIVKCFVKGDYRPGVGIASVVPVTPETERQIRGYIADHGETLVELPVETWNTSVAQWMGTYWDCLVDLWTAESGESDLVLSVRVFETEKSGYRFEVDSVHVP